MSKRLAILGASGHARVVADVARSSGWNEIDFFDDKFSTQTHAGNLMLAGSITDALVAYKNYDGYALGIGDNAIRKRVFNKLADNNLPTPTLIHSTAHISSSVSLGTGTVIMPFACVNADVVVGDGVIVNTHAVVEHDCVLEDFSHISPNAALAGGVKVGECAWVGIGACVKQLITVGESALIGAGAVVVQDVVTKTTVFGVPASIKGY